MSASRSLFSGVLLVGCIVIVSSAAAVENDGVTDRLAEFFQDLPAERVSTGILLDRTLSISDIENYNGSPAAPPTSLRTWRQIAHEIRHASLTEPSWPALEEVLERARQRRRDGAVPIGVMDFRYQRIRPDALDTGALVVRNGRAAIGKGDPFVASRVFAAAALRDVTYRGEDVIFRLDRENYLSSDPRPPRQVMGDFDDGQGFVTIAFGRDHRVHYSVPGRKEIRLRITTADGELLHAAFPFDVHALGTPTPDDTLQVTASIPYQSVFGTGEAYVYLSDANPTLTNPVVVIEGFDLDNSMNWDELYALLNREMLIEDLRGRGFDAVVLNFTDAVDYIQRNSFVAVELIQAVQAAIGPTRDLAVVGASMGGLVGRYALSYMETHALPHAVRTFISFDSPQAGADIPLGIQYWLWFFADVSQEAAALLATLDTPGARQMLVYHHTDPPGATGESDPLRAQFAADLAAIGDYPAGVRKVAISNGSGAQAGQGFSPGEQIIRWEYDGSNVDIIGNVWAVPNGATATIFHGLIDFIFFPPDETIVVVAGTDPFDNAPGGWRNSMAQMDQTPAPFGDIVALHPNHCFIPAISSLALETEDLFYDIAGDPDILAHTPFDVVYFPVVNQEHVSIGPENAVWFIAEIEEGTTGVVPASASVPIAARIDPVAPNPIGASARIRFAVPRTGPVRLSVVDVSGRRVAVLAEGHKEAGEWEATWNGLDAGGARLQSGVYFLNLRGSGFAASRKTVLR